MVCRLRRRREWTQEELAAAAGYTKRLIAKAESGGSLSPDTIEVLAEALSISDDEVHPEDLTTSSTELAVAFMRAYAGHEHEMLEHTRHFMSTEIKGHFPGGPELAPLSGLHNGIDEYESFLRKFFAIFERPDKSMAIDSAVYASSGNHVAVTFFDQLTNAHVPPDAKPYRVVLNMTFCHGELVEIEHLLIGSTLGEVVTLWRENKPGLLDDSDYYSIPYRERELAKSPTRPR